MKHEPVVLINAFEVAVADDEAFLQGWERARNSLRTQDGHLSTQLHKSISPAAEFRFVNVARWQSEGAFRVATARPEFSSRAVPYAFHASLYTVVREDDRSTGQTQWQR